MVNKYQVLYCTYNANGTIFVTGSFDTFARVGLLAYSSQISYFLSRILLAYLISLLCNVENYYYLQVWSALKPNTNDPEQPINEIDLLCGYENDVNYVQFKLDILVRSTLVCFAL